MPQEEYETTFRRNLSLTRRRSFRSGHDRDDRGWTSLHVGAKEGNLKKIGNFSRILNDAAGGHLDIMDELLDRGAGIDARTKGACGWTPLHSAAKARKREAVKFLIENGAFLPEDINDSRINPPLHYCPGLEWAYEEMRRLQFDIPSAGENSGSLES
ncbi:hypothetical protein MLD38_039082 [Melastoma candidum]|uniref:Uncharacterized protein n=1 Tax=Melastoma candidum TaxID=119954 RepID=A0ACB9L0Y9_9MYRT|nr:hypothetical protein MLD38_039082 [Melastoma candidum]